MQTFQGIEILTAPQKTTILITDEILDNEFVIAPDVPSFTPNPAMDQLFIPSDLSTTGNIQIFNVLGEIVFETSGEVSTNRIDVAHWPVGPYFIRFNYKGINYARRLLIQR